MPETFSNVGGGLDLEIKQGATLQLQFTYVDEDDTPVDLTGYLLRMKIRAGFDSAAVLLDCAAYLSLGSDPGTIGLKVPDEITAAIAWRDGVYDLEIESAAGDVTALLYGAVRIVTEATR